MDSVKKVQAAPSTQVRRIEDKLRKHYASLDEKMTPSALNETVGKMHDRIADYANDRVSLEKFGGCFDEGKHPAPASAKVGRVAERIKN